MCSQSSWLSMMGQFYKHTLFHYPSYWWKYQTETGPEQTLSDRIKKRIFSLMGNCDKFSMFFNYLWTHWQIISPSLYFLSWSRKNIMGDALKCPALGKVCTAALCQERGNIFVLPNQICFCHAMPGCEEENSCPTSCKAQLGSGKVLAIATLKLKPTPPTPIAKYSITYRWYR